MVNSKINSDRKFREEWAKEPLFRGWLCGAPEALHKEGYANCKWCKKALRPHKSDLKAHCNTNGHMKNGAAFVSDKQKNLSDCGISNVGAEAKMIDIKLVLHVAAHSTITSIDHLSEMLKQCGKGSLLYNLKLHRTKSSRLIVNVIAPTFLEELIDDIDDQDYSIILDESTDISTDKYMAYCVKYFSMKQKKIITNFLGFHEVTGTTANELYEVFKEFLRKVGLKIEKLIGIGTDGASNLCGKNHSLYTLLRNDVRNLQLVKCLCHSLDLCASKAADELPSNILYLLAETNNWFANRALRKSMYNELYEKCNSGMKPPKFISPSKTRWLVIYTANAVTLKQWKELRLFFTNIAESTSIKCYKARELAAMYRDDTNLLYLTLLDDILKDVSDINLAFQKVNADIAKLYAELRTLTISLARSILSPRSLKSFESNPTAMIREDDLKIIQQALDKTHDDFGNSLLSIDSLDFGSRFEKLATELRISSDGLKAVKDRGVTFIVRLIKELIQRLPANLNVIENVRYFLPTVCLSLTPIPAKNLPWDLASQCADRNAIESQWRRLQSLKLFEMSESLTPSVDLIRFWIAVYELKSANGNRTFEDLAKFVLRILSLPTSNADVERILSIMSIVKTKARNRMLWPMLEALIRIRSHLKVSGICCKSYIATEAMLKRFNKAMYEIDTVKSTREDNFEILEAFEIFEKSVAALEESNV